MIIRASLREMKQWMETNISPIDFAVEPTDAGGYPHPEEGADDTVARGAGWSIHYFIDGDGWDVRFDEEKHELAFILRWR